MDRLVPEIALLDPAEGNKRMRPLETETERLVRESKSLNIQYKLERMRDLAGKAEDLQTDGNNAVHEMGQAGIRVLEVIKAVTAIHSVLGSGVDPQLLRVSIETAEHLLAEMEKHDFAATRAEAESEQQEARAVMDAVTEQAAPVDKFKENVQETEGRLETLEVKIADIQLQTATADSLTREASNINFRNKAPQASQKIDRIQDIQEATRASQALGEELVVKAEQFADQANEFYTGLSIQADALTATQEEVRLLAENNRAEAATLAELEAQAREKASSLSNQAADLSSIAAQAQGPAEQAIQAASAFQNILTAVTEAEAAANQAEEDAGKAAEMSFGVTDKAENSLARIQELDWGDEGAKQALDLVKMDLAPNLENSQRKVDLLTTQHKEIKQDLETINDQLAKMADLSGDIVETKKQAEDSLKDGDDALASIDARATEISKQKKVAYEVRDANSEFQLARTNIEKSLTEYESQPSRNKRQAEEGAGLSVGERLANLQDKQEVIERLGDRNSGLLSNIRDTLQQARSALQKMTKPAVKFQRGSTLELENPPNLAELTTKTDVSFYVNRSSEAGGSGKSDDRAFLFYMGHLEETNKKIPQVITDDYMAVQVLKDGRVSLSMDIGSGPLTLDSNYALKDSEWHQVAVERAGRQVRLIVRSEAGPEEVSEDVVSGEFPLLDQDGKPFLSGSVFNLHPDHTKIYVGGFPTDRTAVQDIVRSTDMTGSVEGLLIGGQEVGLWNYKAARLIGGANTR